jgi:hypothetical protein
VTEAAHIVVRSQGSEWLDLGRPIWSAHSLSSIRWVGDRFVAVGADGGQGASYDGLDWRVTGTGLESTSMQDVAHAAGRTIAVGLGGEIIGSEDNGETWPLSNAMADVALRGGVRGNSTSVIVGGNFAWFGRGHILTSADRRNWDLQFRVGYESVYDVAYGAGRFVGLRYIQELAGGWHFIESTNGESWHRVGASIEGRAPSFANSIQFDGGRFLLAGSKATLGISNNGSDWRFSSLETAGSGAFSSATSNGSLIVAVGHTATPDATGLVATTTDGENLVRRNARNAPKLSGVTWGAGKFVAVGVDGWIMASGNGFGWTRIASPTTENLLAVRWLGSGFVAVGEMGTVLTSRNGLSWKIAETGTHSTIYDVFGDGSDYFVVGDHGLVMRSRCVGRAPFPRPREQ